MESIQSAHCWKATLFQNLTISTGMCALSGLYIRSDELAVWAVHGARATVTGQW